MSDEDPARDRDFVMVGARLVGVAGAMVGLVLLGRAVTLTHRVLGLSVVLAGMVVMAVLPLSLARRWRTPPDA